MSEYQFVHFIAIDRPLSDEQMEFMQRQSTRPEPKERSMICEHSPRGRLRFSGS